MKTGTLLVLLPIIFVLALGVFHAWGETSSCRQETKGEMTQCMEFAAKGGLPQPLTMVCTMTGSGKWKANDTCPKQGMLGECNVKRDDSIVQKVYCYKRAGVPDKEKIGYCKQSCKGKFTAY